MTKRKPDEAPRRRPRLMGGLRNNFLTGIVVIAPIGLTVWLIWTVVGWVDSFVLPFVPRAYQPEAIVNRLLDRSAENWITVNVRGVGVIFFLMFTVVVGWLAKGFIGRSFLRWGESLVARMPVVRSIYSGAKQIAETVFAQTESSFETACLIEYPRRGAWSIAFISTRTRGEIVEKVGNGDMLSVFVPTTPNPTSGFLLFVPAADVVELEMTIEEAAKLVISAGLVYPGGRAEDMPEPVREDLRRNGRTLKGET